MLKQTGEIDVFKLHKLLYYAQAWHLVWEGEPLFPEQIEAWAGGPVIPELYKFHKGYYKIKAVKREKKSGHWIVVS
jgi:uncharacterized phage-associated protein